MVEEQNPMARRSFQITLGIICHLVWIRCPPSNALNDTTCRYLTVLVSAVTILSIGVRDLDGLGLSAIWNQGLGSVNPNAIFTPLTTETDVNNAIIYPNPEAPLSGALPRVSPLMWDVILINLPQLLLSGLYFLYNGMFTCMLAGREWSFFGSHRRALRVSIPTLQQRSTYWLSMPWRYSIPLIASSSLMHWLVSRSLFLVRVLVFDHNDQHEPDRDISACGYSPLAIVVVIVLLLLMLIVVIGFSLRPLAPGAPVVGVCSWSISAACHPPADDTHAAFKPVKWGVTRRATEDEPGHCSLTSLEVEEPVVGQLYM